MKRRSFLKRLAGAATAVMLPLHLTEFGTTEPVLGPNEFWITGSNRGSLLAYQMPITKIIEMNSVKDIQEIEDRAFIEDIQAAVDAFQGSGEYSEPGPNTFRCFEEWKEGR